MKFSIGDLQRRLMHLKEKLSSISAQDKYVLFLSYGNEEHRATVLKAHAETFEKAWRKVEQLFLKKAGKAAIPVQWIKVDMATAFEKHDLADVYKSIQLHKKNYFRKGVAFDDQFAYSFLEQEINGNAMIFYPKGAPPAFNERNINHYLKQSTKTQFPLLISRVESVWLFDTIGFFDENGQLQELVSGGPENGIRKRTDGNAEIESFIRTSTDFLGQQIQPNGQFTYGYFPAFDKQIPHYNILRHASTVYAMLEGYETLSLSDGTLFQKMEQALLYVLENDVLYHDHCAFVLERSNDNEIKLGANAALLLALTKYMQVSGSDRFMTEAKAIARGILFMQNDRTGDFIHVLSYPSLEMKDRYRIIYYDGEAAFSLMRLYALDRSDEWLKPVQQLFDHFIANDYWKHHDHWLSYATNELIQYDPAEKYVQFGLKNVEAKLSFIYDRLTTFPTFLELTMAAWHMVEKVKSLGMSHLLDDFDEAMLLKTIHKRADHQRTGYFFPESAMYMKTPKRILSGFFIRHHSFRVRIDDIEHNLSGYCHYYQTFVPRLVTTER